MGFTIWGNKTVEVKNEYLRNLGFNRMFNLFKITKTNNDVVDVEANKNDGEVFVGGLPLIKEYILCSAIHFDDGKEHIHEPSNIQTGFVVCGRRHHNCFYTASLMGEKVKQFKKVQGFLTNTNRFVNREEAGEIAFKSGQIKEETDCLFSEDLW